MVAPAPPPGPYLEPGDPASLPLGSGPVAASSLAATLPLWRRCPARAGVKFDPGIAPGAPMLMLVHEERGIIEVRCVWYLAGCGLSRSAIQQWSVHVVVPMPVAAAPR